MISLIYPPSHRGNSPPSIGKRALALLIFGDTIYCIQAIKQQEVTNCTAERE
jgi:hypothetical protein